ncbi:MAG TPA: hypothetical protein VHE35_29900, partial [Kofleriaceae bacterium]|nr:hypothetical protein [Kofleriaceae bacterium]
MTASRARSPAGAPHRARAAALLAIVALAGCPRGAPVHPRPPLDDDLPYQLADDGDLAERRDALWAMPPGPDRSALRVELAAALADRARGWLRARRVDRLGEVIQSLAELWLDEPAALPRELAGQRDLLVDARAAFARAGADRAAALTLVLLAKIDPASAPARRDELEQILVYADDLARSRDGELARDTGAIDVLAAIDGSVDEPALVTREVDLVVGRANRADASLAHAMASGAKATSPIYRLALHATFDLTVTLAIHHRARELAGVLDGLRGLGRDRRLAAKAAPVAAAGATAEAWSNLAAALHDRAADDDALDDDDRTQAERAALALCDDGLVRFPDDATLLVAAATHAAALGRLVEPIALYERARRRAPADRE